MSGKLERIFGEILDSMRTGGVSAITTYKPDREKPKYNNWLSEAIGTGGLSTVLRFGEAEQVPVCNLNRAPDNIGNNRLTGVLGVVKSELCEVHSAAKEAAQLAVREVLDVASGNFGQIQDQEVTTKSDSKNWPPDWNWPPRPPRED